MHRSVSTLSPNYFSHFYNSPLPQLTYSLPFPPSPSLSPSLSVASGEVVTDMATVASDLFHVVNGAFTMKKMCEQSMNQSLHDGSVEGEHCHCIPYMLHDYYFSCTLIAVSLYALSSSSSQRMLSILSFLSISIDRLMTYTLLILPISYFLLS